MKGNRDMYYGNYQMGAFKEPEFIPPSGYNMNTSFSSYGPNVIPQNMNQNYNTNQNINNNYIDEYDNRITKLERQIRRLDQRLRKLENSGILEEEVSNDSNLYMI